MNNTFDFGKRKLKIHMNDRVPITVATYDYKIQDGCLSFIDETENVPCFIPLTSIYKFYVS